MAEAKAESVYRRLPYCCFIQTEWQCEQGVQLWFSEEVVRSAVPALSLIGSLSSCRPGCVPNLTLTCGTDFGTDLLHPTGKTGNSNSTCTEDSQETQQQCQLYCLLFTYQEP